MLLKKTIFSLFATVGLCANATAQLRIEVCECFELTSIVFRLAQSPEYSDTGVWKFTSEADKYFAAHKAHPVVEYAKELRAKQKISYNAVTSAAAFIEIKNGKVLEIQSNDLPEYRWTKESFTKFVGLLDDFYRQTKFNDFYASHAKLRQMAVDRYDAIFSTTDLDWFVSFFGGDLPKCRVVLSLCNGRNNYGFSNTDGAIGATIGLSSNGDGEPANNSGAYSILIHELIHSYANKIVDRNWAQMKQAADTIFNYVGEKMTASAYSEPKIVMYEWLVRLFTIMYEKEHPTKYNSVEELASNEEYFGFTWMMPSVKLMDEFYADRDKYKTIDDFVPQLVIFINYTAAKMAIHS